MWARCPPGNEGGGEGLTARTKRVGVLVPPFERKGGGYLVDLYIAPSTEGGVSVRPLLQKGGLPLGPLLQKGVSPLKPPFFWKGVSVCKSCVFTVY